MKREARRHSAPPRVVIGSALALLMFLGALDLHSPKLIATFATTTPVLCSSASPLPPPHIEPAGAALAPDHPPALFRALRILAQPRMGQGAAVCRPRLSGYLEVPAAPRLAEEVLESWILTRGPPHLLSA